MGEKVTLSLSFSPSPSVTLTQRWVRLEHHLQHHLRHWSIIPWGQLSALEATFGFSIHRRHLSQRKWCVRNQSFFHELFFVCYSSFYPKMDPPQLIASKNGKIQLYNCGYSLYINKSTKDKFYLQCTHKKPTQCKARAIVKGELEQGKLKRSLFFLWTEQ